MPIKRKAVVVYCLIEVIKRHEPFYLMLLNEQLGNFGVKLQFMMSFSMWLSNSQKSLYKWIANTFGTTQPLLFTGATIGVGIISGAAYLYTNPESLFYWTDRYMLSSAGFSVKYIQGNNCTFCYAEHGQLRSDKPSLLFIDRFSGRKESWMKVCKGLPSALHIICVELPGQGDTTLHEDQNMASLYRLTDLLAEFASLLNLEVVPHHVVGWSMGGSVAALYAAKYPQFVRRLTLIAPLMQCPIETEFWSVKEDTEHLPFLTNDPEQLKVLAEKSFHNPDLAPKSLWVYKALIKRIQTKREFLKELYVNMKEEITEESSKFDNLLSKIKCPVQVIWGEQDQIVHVSGASFLEDLIPAVKQTTILPKCGHAVCSEQTDTISSLIANFYNLL